MQNMRFSRLRQVACKSPGQTARTLIRKLWKNFLSVFRNWKFHSRESRKLSRKNFCVPLVTGPSTYEQVANLSREKHEKPIFLKNILSFFRDWSIYPPRSRQWVAKKSLWWTCNWGMWLVLPATESPEQGKTIFEIFGSFLQKQSTFQKQLIH